MNSITIVTSPTCSYCHAAKDLLEQHAIKFREVDLIQESKQAQELMIKSGQRTVPQIFVGSRSIGGFSELYDLINDNEFELSQLQNL